MALGFIKKVFSFGNKDVEKRPAEDEPLAPLNFEALKAFAAESQADQPQPAAVETPRVDAEAITTVQNEAPALPPLRGGLGSEADRGGVVSAALDAARPRPTLTPVAVPLPPEPAPEEVPTEPEPPSQPAPETPPDTAPAEIPLSPIPSQPAPAAPEAPPLEVPPVEPPHTPAEVPIEVPTPAPRETPELAPQFESNAPAPSPNRGGSVGKADRGGVADEAHGESSSVPFNLERTSSLAETTPSGPAGHLPLEGGEPSQLAPTPPSTNKVTVTRAIEAKPETVAPAPVPSPRTTWFQRLREGLSRSSRELTGSIAGIFTKRKLDEETLEELEDVLIRADLGMETAIRITDTLSASRYGKDVSDSEVRAIMAQEVEKVLWPVALPLELDLSHKPHVILVVGVNGTGKTTTIGKLAAKLTAGGLSVMLAAGDTFRAAAIEQLKIWGERTNSPVVSSKLGADAAGLAWDAFEKAREAGSDVLIIDTAGRLQNKAELMSELEKIVRVLGKHDPEAPHTVLQTVDATTGQNALNQVEIFRNVAGVSGLVMTKLDGTARGGILVAIAAKHKLPVYFIGIGEQVDDLEPFSAEDFAKAIAGIA